MAGIPRAQAGRLRLRVATQPARFERGPLPVRWRESTDPKSLHITIRFACPVEQRVAVEQEIFRRFWRSLQLSPTAVAREARNGQLVDADQEPSGLTLVELAQVPELLAELQARR